jgi:hypothetical protein
MDDFEFETESLDGNQLKKQSASISYCSEKIGVSEATILDKVISKLSLCEEYQND